MLPEILTALEFCSNNARHRPVLDALQWLVRNRDNGQRYIALTPDIPVESVIRPKWRDIVVEENDGKPRINRINYEICVLQALRDGLRCKEIWVVHADRYRNPDDDLPRDFDQNREGYYQDLGCTADAVEFTDNLKESDAGSADSTWTGRSQEIARSESSARARTGSRLRPSILCRSRPTWPHLKKRGLLPGGQ